MHGAKVLAYSIQSAVVTLVQTSVVGLWAVIEASAQITAGRISDHLLFEPIRSAISFTDPNLPQAIVDDTARVHASTRTDACADAVYGSLGGHGAQRSAFIETIKIALSVVSETGKHLITGEGGRCFIDLIGLHLVLLISSR